MWLISFSNAASVPSTTFRNFLVGVEQGVRETAEGKPASPPPSGCRAGDKPRVRKENIFPDSCVLEIEVPGYNKDLVRVKAEANKTFTVTLKNDPKLKGMDQKFSVAISKNRTHYDYKKGSGKVVDGILYLTVPKKAANTGEGVNINVN